MKAVCWNGKQDIRVERVPDPELVNPRDAIIRVTSSAICGSDLHLYDGCVPGMRAGDILGHEFMGEVVEVGRSVRNLAPGDRVVVPFTISCGRCWFCEHDLFAACDNSNPNAAALEKLYGRSPGGFYGYSHLFGGYAGGQAEYVRVPFADVGPIKVPGGLRDEQVLFLGDIFPTGFQAAEQANIKPDDTVAVWGCGPVGQFTIRSAFFLGADRVVAIDRVPERLSLAARCGAETLDFGDEQVHERLMDATAGRGPDVCIDAVGLEPHGLTLDNVYDRVKVAARMVTDRGHVLREAIRACRKGGTVSVIGVYGGSVDKFPIGAAFNK
ncbi:MAG: zinc-dependent alcohol dehydrogenase, partial [Planctomycetota bacterium]